MYSYNFRDRGAAMDPSRAERMLAEVLDGLRSLHHMAQQAGAGSATRAFQAALHAAEEGGEWVLEASQGSAAIGEQVKKALLEALESPDRDMGHSAHDADEVYVSYRSYEIPKYPPDDDGPGDRAYWQKVREEERAAEKIVSRVLSQFRGSVLAHEVRYAEKGHFQVTVGLK